MIIFIPPLTPIPMPMTDTLIELLETVLSEEEAVFMPTFARSSMNIEEIKKRCGLDYTSLDAMRDELLPKGALIVSTSRGSRMDVYIFDVSVSRPLRVHHDEGEKGEGEKRLESCMINFSRN